MSLENLHQKRPELHKSLPVQSAMERKRHRENLSEKEFNKLNSNPTEKLEAYLDRFKEVFDRKNIKSKERGIEALKKIAKKYFVIESEKIPKKVYELDQQIARERGYGYIELYPEYIERKNKEIIDGQIVSLNSWIDYLTSSDAFYPDWFKYLAFEEIVKMGKLDKGNFTFEKRSNTTVSPFPELNSEALGMVLKMIQQANKIEDYSMVMDEKVKNIAKKSQFSKLYPIALKQLEELRIKNQKNLEHIQGSWVKFDQGSDYTLLENSLTSYSTGWCTASGSAEAQLHAGDFYVFYSKDDRGQDKVPRIAIRMEDEQIAEIRGIGQKQELEPGLVETMEEKAKTLNGYEYYQKASQDMKRLTEIEKKTDNDDTLTTEEIRFLYELDDEISGFGYERDPRIEEVREKRDKREDLALVFNCEPEEIILYEDDPIGEEIAYVDLEVAKKLGRDWNSPAHLLQFLSSNGNREVRQALAANNNLPEDVLLKLVEDDDQNVREAAASNPTLPKEVIIKLSEEEDLYLRRGIASNKNTPPKTLIKLSKDSEPLVKKAATHNTNHPDYEYHMMSLYN
jgi:hypothetical protein